MTENTGIQDGREQDIIKRKEIEVTPMVTAFSYLQKIIRSKKTERLEENLDHLEKEREEANKTLVSLSFNNDISKAPQPLVKDFKITDENYTKIFKKLLEIQDTETSEAMRLLYQYMYEQKSFNIDRVDGKKLLEMGGYKDIRPENIDKILRLILRYINITITVLDPVKTKLAREDKKSKVKTIYKNFTVLQIREFGTNKDEEGLEDGTKEMLLELSDVKFMDGYMEFINNVSRSYVPIKAIHKIPKTTAIKDKRRYFITNICDILSSLRNQPYVIQKSLEECMTLGDFHNNRWQTEKRKAWKPIESSLFEANKHGLLRYKWIFRTAKESEIQKDKLIVDDNNEIKSLTFKNKEKMILDSKYYGIVNPK
jgi:hypothetical protein